jgi:flavorubredoxin
LESRFPNAGKRRPMTEAKQKSKNTTMNTIDLLRYVEAKPSLATPTILHRDGEHAVYWLGIDADTAFRCNAYLVEDSGEGYLIDPGGRPGFAQIRERVEQIMPTRQIKGMVLCHQDPDVAASMADWLDIHPEIEIYSSMRTHALLPHYGKPGYRRVDIVEHPVLALPSGARLKFIEAPFLHFPGAFATYDEAAGFLFSGDIWAAVGIEWTLVSDDFDALSFRMEMFHTDYMASNKAARGFTNKLRGLDIAAILPQHGSVIPRRHVAEAIAYLNDLPCGLDLLYLTDE